MEATVLIPTFLHVETVRYAIRSVQAQTLQDFEILVVGDGAPLATRDLVSELTREDPRIHFCGFPKGPRHGEIMRHAVLENARGRCVCYLSDDDLWLPSHLENLTGLLKGADLVNAAELCIQPSGVAVLNTFDINNPLDRSLFEEFASGFGLSSGGHTLEAYRRLPHGWRTTPAGIATDMYMWQQFMEQPWCRAESSCRPTVLKFPAELWEHLESPQVRLDALKHWLERATEAGGEAKLAWRAFESVWRPSTHPRRMPRHARINTYDEFPPYELGTEIHLAASRAGYEYFSWGWSLPEPWGVWSDGDEARLTFLITNLRCSRLVLEFRFLAALSPQRRTISIDLTGNGASVARWEIATTSEQRRSVEIAAAERIDLRFLIPYAPPLNEVADTVDHRRLGIGLIAFNIRPAS